ncbi:MAG: hypothetical protein J0I33_13865 [Microbacterium ginsengisoli]|uniref:hypothetical protein n=1 Tax=Microbacterium TaxID=33882 RepID=UPI0006FD02A7|nr:MULTISPECIES: hypothetical protein [unclassified Microbacterium]KQR90987.1 hypothetical protein ASF93_08710 [Microbacterium sp. Leaf347]KQS00015.1 hypothetical protein ASG00_11010 [Microbacterium sp. Leaf351]MBN9199717.1 hypothetical protein [Microbacterium ginsengisoli]OJU75244.1 MAG: hypothetical protein BGO15_04245 [Microbacterium sp. 71-23]
MTDLSTTQSTTQAGIGYLNRESIFDADLTVTGHSDRHRVTVVNGQPTIDATHVSVRFSGAEMVVDTSTVAGERVVSLERDGEVMWLTRAEAYDLVLAVLGRLGVIGFPGDEDVTP